MGNHRIIEPCTWPAAQPLLNSKLCGVVDMLEGSKAIQRDLDRLEMWTLVNLRKFNRTKCKVQHMSGGNPKHK